MAAQDTSGVNRNRGCCFNYFPCFAPTPQPPSSSTSSSSSASLWESSDNSNNNNKWWARPIHALKKIREWSEIVAGPKWKTFIRRFNRKPRHHQHGHVSTGKYNYDPLSYALNFDQGHQVQNGHFDDEWVHSAPTTTTVKLAVVV